MCECEVCRLWIDEECQCLIEHSEGRIYLSKVQIEKKQKTFFEKVIEVALELFFSYSVTFFVGKWAIELAYQERGYEAVGGEYFLIMMTYMFSFWLIRKFFERG